MANQTYKNPTWSQKVWMRLVNPLRNRLRAYGARVLNLLGLLDPILKIENLWDSFGEVDGRFHSVPNDIRKLTKRIKELEEFREKATKTINKYEDALYYLLAQDSDQFQLLKRRIDKNEANRSSPFYPRPYIKSNFLRDEPDRGDERSALLRSDSAGVSGVCDEGPKPDTKPEGVPVADG